MPAQNNPFAAKIAEMSNAPALAAPRQYPAKVAKTVTLATEKQCRFILTLAGERNYADHKWATRIHDVVEMVRKHIDLLDAEVFGTAPITTEAASNLINTLLHETKAIDVRRTTAAKFENVIAGRYAVATDEGAANELAFYKVDRPEDGRWAGYVFVKLMRSDEEVRLSRDTSNAVLAKIAVDPAAASAAYGHHIGECGICGRTLTNDESRARGIGPVCAAKAGW